MSQQINLVNPLLLKKRYAFGLREMGMGLGLILLGILVWTGVQYYQAGVLESRAAQQEARQEEAQQELDQMMAAATRPVSALLSERVKATQVQVAQHEALLGAIDGTIKGTSTGFASRFRALAHSSTEGVWLNGFTLAPGYVGLKGSVLNADMLTTYIDRLGKQAPFSGIQFSGMNALLAQSGSGEASQAAALPDHLDFDLYSGSLDAQSEQGTLHGQ